MDLAESSWKEVSVEQQRIAIANSFPVIGRYLFAMPVETARTISGYIDAGRLRVISAQLSHIRSGQSWEVEWADEQSETFDAVVCATGFRKPQWRASADTLVWCADPLPAHHQLQVTPDLRVLFDGAFHPERIWTIGIASHLAVPVVNSVYQTVRQVYRIFQCWRSSSHSAALAPQADNRANGSQEGS